jgi:hypothetical protein
VVMLCYSAMLAKPAPRAASLPEGVQA